MVSGIPRLKPQKLYAGSLCSVVLFMASNLRYLKREFGGAQEPAQEQLLFPKGCRSLSPHRSAKAFWPQLQGFPRLDSTRASKGWKCLALGSEVRGLRGLFGGPLRPLALALTWGGCWCWGLCCLGAIEIQRGLCLGESP